MKISTLSLSLSLSLSNFSLSQISLSLKFLSLSQISLSLQLKPLWFSNSWIIYDVSFSLTFFFIIMKRGREFSEEEEGGEIFAVHARFLISRLHSSSSHTHHTHIRCTHR